MRVTSSIPLLLLWLLASVPIVVAAAETSSNLATVLTQVEGDIPSCALRCFRDGTDTTTSCSLVEDFITSAVTSCLQANCTTHQRLEAQKLITQTCGTEARSIQGSIRGIAWTLWATAAIFLGGRLIARSSFFSGVSLGNDDWAILLSFAVLTAVTIGAELMVCFGLGTDMWTLDDLHINLVLILFYVAEFAYVIESAITKVSILLLYLRIFPDRTFRTRCWVLMTVMVLFCIAFVVTLLTYCVPFDYTWMRWDNERTGKCIDMDAQTYACASMNIVLDLIIFLIPIPQLSKLDLSKKKKTGIIFTFLVGVFVTVCSMIRLQALVGWTASTNPTMDFANLAVWSLVELDVGVICACMPGMAGLFRRLKRQHSDYVRSKCNNSNDASQALGTPGAYYYTSSKGGGQPQQNQSQKQQTITKTTVISVKHSRRGDGDGGSLDSQLELVDR